MQISKHVVRDVLRVLLKLRRHFHKAGLHKPGAVDVGIVKVAIPGQFCRLFDCLFVVSVLFHCKPECGQRGDLAVKLFGTVK